MRFGDEWLDVSNDRRFQNRPWRIFDFIKFPAAFLIHPLAFVVRRPMETLAIVLVMSAAGFAAYQLLVVTTPPSWAAPLQSFARDVVGEKFLVLAVTVLAYMGFRFGQHVRDRRKGRPTWADAYWDWLFEGEMGVLVLGIGGTGKSTLGTILQYEHKRQRIRNLLVPNRYRNLGEIEDVVAQPYDPTDLMGAGKPYAVSNDLERYRIGYCRTMTIAPGQYKQHDLWKPQIRALGRHRRAILINVLAFGYAAPYRFSKNSIEEIAVREGVSPQNFEAEYTEKKRIEEAEATSKIVGDMLDELEGKKTKIVLVNLVNMAGFWWKDKERAAAHYSGKYYADLMQTLEARFTNGRLAKCECEFVPISMLFDELTNDPHKTGKPKETIFQVDESDRVTLKKISGNVIRHIRSEVYRKGWKKNGKGRVS